MAQTAEITKRSYKTILAECSNEEIYAKAGYEGYGKIGQEHGYEAWFVSLYNPITHDYKTDVVFSYQFKHDNGEYIKAFLSLPVDEELEREWLHDNGKILVGDMVVVEKGRNVRIGTISYVKDIKPVYDKYKRVVAHKVFLSNGEITYLSNVRRVKQGFAA